MSDLAILVPVLDRPRNVEPLVCSIEKSTRWDWQIVFVADPDDGPEQRAIARALKVRPGRIDLLIHDGNYASKINFALGEIDADFYFLGADDLTFHEGWFEAARKPIDRGVAAVVGTQDLCNRRTILGIHATHFLVTREYTELGQYDGSDGLLCEVYEHNCVDDELIATSRKRGAYYFANDSHVEHRHPLNGTAESDATYVKGTDSIRRDRAVLRQRRPIWS